MNSLIIHPEWDLAKRMAKEWHPIGQFLIFAERSGLPWFGLSFNLECDPRLDVYEAMQQRTIRLFGEFCAKWQPELEKRGILIADDFPET